MQYRAEIDGLRALAVMPVIFFHAGFDWFSGGFVGVDVFFVISGYLIATIIINDLAEDRFSLLRFYERRARRILPALFLVMMACLPFAWLWLTPTDLKDFGQSLIAVSFFTSNILFWLESGYFDTAAELKPLLHTWSLAVEEQYYLIFPLFLLATWQLGNRWVLALLSAILITSLVWAHWSAYQDPVFSFFLLPTRIWELLIGVLAAFYLRSFSHPASPLTNQVISLVGVGLVVYACIAFDEHTPFPGLYALVPTLGTALLIVSAVPGTLVNRVLGFGPVVGIGLISYSAYLIHQPLFAFARHRTEGQVPDMLLLALTLATLVLAYGSWRWVERPARDGKQTTGKTIVSFSLVGVALFCMLGWKMHDRNGYPDRIDALLDYETIAISPLRGACHTQLEPCEYFGDSIEWATFGDSHVVELTYALSVALEAYNVGIQHNSHSACRPVLNENSDACAKWSELTLKRIVADKRIRHVVVGYRMTNHLHGESLGVYPDLPEYSTSAAQNRVWNDLLGILSMLENAGKEVYFVVQQPELPDTIEKLAAWNRSDPLIKGVSRAWWDARSAFVRQRLDEIPDSVRLVDTQDLFCDERWCYGNDEGGYLYFDDDHVSVYGAGKITERILQLNP